jgi:hypothetical protein
MSSSSSSSWSGSSNTSKVKLRKSTTASKNSAVKVRSSTFGSTGDSSVQLATGQKLNAPFCRVIFVHKSVLDKVGYGDKCADSITYIPFGNTRQHAGIRFRFTDTTSESDASQSVVIQVHVEVDAKSQGINHDLSAYHCLKIQGGDSKKAPKLVEIKAKDACTYWHGSAAFWIDELPGKHDMMYRTDDHTLSHIKFDGFSLKYVVGSIARTLSQWQGSYHILACNCYTYAYLLLQQMQLWYQPVPEYSLTGFFTAISADIDKKQLRKTTDKMKACIQAAIDKDAAQGRMKTELRDFPLLYDSDVFKQSEEIRIADVVPDSATIRHGLPVVNDTNPSSSNSQHNSSGNNSSKPGHSHSHGHGHGHGADLIFGMSQEAFQVVLILFVFIFLFKLV